MSDITPDTHFIESIRADRGSYTALLAEGVDNAFDAGASDVALTLRKDLVGLQDNGIGISRDRELAIVRLGEHRAMPTTMLGTFGIGIKYHAVSAGDVIEVESISVDGRMTLRADWRAIVKHGRWVIPDPIWRQALRGSATGTRIDIRALRWPPPAPRDIDRARDTLAQLFYPALVTQRSISLNDAPLQALREPALTNQVDGEVRLTSGKGARVRAGITLEPSSLYMVQVSYKHRVIMPQSTFGCGNSAGLRRMFGRVELTGPWSLARFKNALADNEADELEDRVSEILAPVLEACRGAEMSAKVEEMTALLNEMLPPELTPARPVKEGEKVPVKSQPRGVHGGLTRTGAETPRGPARRPRSGELKIEFDAPYVDEFGYGYFAPGRPNRIILAQDNPYIATLLNLRDTALGAETLYSIALMIYQHHRDMNGPKQPDLYDAAEPFGLRVWKMTQRQKAEE